MDIWWNNITIDEVRILFVLCIDLPQGFNELDWICLDVGLDLFGLDWYLDVGYIGLT